jgi:hypothetical protein
LCDLSREKKWSDLSRTKVLSRALEFGDHNTSYSNETTMKDGDFNP